MSEPTHESVELYDDAYSVWKNWDPKNFAKCNAGDRLYFDAEMRRAGVANGQRIGALEIGFGNGSFLAYARTREWDVRGTEANESLVRLASNAGFDVIHAATLDGFASDSFDLVAAFDVFEHIEQHALPDFLRSIRRVLRDDGVLVARFPNGDSPFGLVNQNGDPTHITAIGSEKAKSLIAMTGFKAMFVGGEAEPWLAFTTEHTIHRWFSYVPKLLINLAVRLIFYPRGNVSFCSANLTMICRKVGHQK